MGDEDGERQQQEDGAFGVEAGEKDGEDNQTAGDGVARGEETFGGGKQADDGEGDGAESDQRGEKDAFDGGVPGEEGQEGGAKIVPELREREIGRPEQLGDDGGVDDGGGDEGGETGRVLMVKRRWGWSRAKMTMKAAR